MHSASHILLSLPPSLPPSPRTDKGMKLEWATVKDDKLVLGSFGKAYTKPGREGGREGAREGARDEIKGSPTHTFTSPFPPSLPQTVPS